MRMQHNIYLLIIVIVVSSVLTACGQSQSSIQTSVALTLVAMPSNTPLSTDTPVSTDTPIPSNTPYFTYTPYPTYTNQPIKVVTATLSPTPKFTPTDTSTPTQTSTPSPTSTPIPLNAFKPLDNWEAVLTNPGEYTGQLVKAFTSPATILDFTGYFMFSPDYGPRGVYCYLIVDHMADETAQKLGKLDWMWIYAKIIDIKNDKPQLSVYHIDEIPLTQQPKSDGLYQVGVDIAPGRWKSGMALTDTDSCYWERNDSNGNIINNYFGIGGITMYVGSGDTVIQFDGCGEMFFLGQ